MFFPYCTVYVIICYLPWFELYCLYRVTINSLQLSHYDVCVILDAITVNNCGYFWSHHSLSVWKYQSWRILRYLGNICKRNKIKICCPNVPDMTVVTVTMCWNVPDMIVVTVTIVQNVPDVIVVTVTLCQNVPDMTVVAVTMCRNVHDMTVVTDHVSNCT